MIWELQEPKRQGKWIVVVRPGPKLREVLESTVGIGGFGVSASSQAVVVPRRRKRVSAQRWLDEHRGLIVSTAMAEWTLPTETVEMIPREDRTDEWIVVELLAPPWDISGLLGPPTGGRILY